MQTKKKVSWSEVEAPRGQKAVF